MTSKNTEPQSPEQVYLEALRLLTARDYTESRLKEKLAGRGHDAVVVDAVMERLIAEGWVNDRRFAERFAETALASARCLGPRLRQEMRRRGIPADIVSSVLAGLMEGHDEEADIRSILERRYSGFSFSSADDRDKRRVVGFLQRRGFGFSAIMRVLRSSGDE